jgi:hypothetical protein
LKSVGGHDDAKARPEGRARRSGAGQRAPASDGARGIEAVTTTPGAPKGAPRASGVGQRGPASEHARGFGGRSPPTDL